ncbi:MAG: hypothetical protein HC788_15365 [Sphingopyxis sp.]|nr:hypothetical protein [Sphingopyxis sp.]
MKAIQTIYNGIKYRSRAEARWAVVFHQIGWRHWYEVGGFHLPSGSYLPDFFLPDLKAFFEVKGQMPNWHEKKLADELAVATEQIVIVSHGPPDHRRSEWANDLSVFYPEMSVDDEIYADWHEGGFVSGRQENHPKCSIDLGNLAYLRGCNDVSWQTAFVRAANQRFGVFDH